MKKRKIFPLPLEPIALHPDILALPAAGYGMLMRILVHWVMTDCRDLPTSPAELFGIARAHQGVWASHRDKILKIFDEIKPAILEDRSRRVAGIAHLGNLRDKAASIKRSARLQKTIDSPRSIHDANVSRPSAEVRSRKVTASVPRSAPLGTFRD